MNITHFSLLTSSLCIGLIFVLFISVVGCPSYLTEKKIQREWIGTDIKTSLTLKN